MRPNFTRIIVAVASLIVGVFIGSIHRHAQQLPPSTPSVSADVPATTPAPQDDVFPEERYPEDLTTEPYEIAEFIRKHPGADLDPLWQRLGIPNDDPINGSSFSRCGICETAIFKYNLDDDVSTQTVLQLKEFVESYRYLVFTENPDGSSKFIGHIDVWAKYPPNDPMVMISNGRPWLIVESTAGTGSGFAAWRQTVYEVSNERVRPVGSYIARLTEADIGPITKVISGRPLSCEIRGRNAILTLSYTLEYFEGRPSGIPTSYRRRKAVLLGSPKDGSVSLDARHSEITRREFETIYNF